MVLVLCCTGWWLTRPMLSIYGNETQKVVTMNVTPETKLEISFIHSVQKTLVEEFLVPDEKLKGFVLNSTKYHSFGVGLPFMESDGAFRQEGNAFIMDDMNRHFNELNLRTGVGTKLTVTVDDQKFELYEMFEPGQKIDIVIIPRYKTFLR
ncbi:hypothetical protein NZ47_04900 [Anaerovibrio lipolyticus]|uniref:DUF1850 domain-containing protein n=1 Tax=Anaerovibrio lipolyticus TaxID=82374 RepID=A0A0B2JVR2_9FIRM|nr:hypothetical protein NZ47_04900 [Anaerovibrio lipolyticus]